MRALIPALLICTVLLTGCGNGTTGGTATGGGTAAAPLTILPGEIVGQLPTAESLGGLLGFPLFAGGQP